MGGGLRIAWNLRCCNVVCKAWNLCSIHHVYKEGNQATDFLAKLGVSSSIDDYVWDEPPLGLKLILLADVSGTLHMR